MMVSVPPFFGVPALAGELPLAEEPLLVEQPAARASTAAAAAASRTRFHLDVHLLAVPVLALWLVVF